MAGVAIIALMARSTAIFDSGWPSGGSESLRRLIQDGIEDGVTCDIARITFDSGLFGVLLCFIFFLKSGV